MIRFNRLFLSIIIGFTFAFAFSGCSGGGGGSDDSGGGASGLTYSGVTTPAQVDESNAEEITGGAFATGLIGDGMVGLSVNQQIESCHIRNFRSVKVPIILSDSLNLVDFSSSSSGGMQAATQTESDIIEGSCGGTMSYSVTVDDQQGTFNGRFTFSDYCNDGTIINGAARFDGRMDVDSGNFIEATFSFDNLSGGELFLDGEIQIDFAATPNVVTFNAYGQDPVTGAVFWIQNYRITIDEFAGYVEIEMAGRFYHPDFGYVTLATPEPLVLHDGDEWPESGALIVAGANDSKAKLTAIDDLTCTVEVDRDGDGTYEWDSDIISWEDL
jgi:hypothetical protein